MDVVTIEKTKENFRILYDVKGRFILKKIKSDEAKYKLCKVKSRSIGPNKIPYIVTHDGRTFRYPDPNIKVNDTLKLNLVENKIRYNFKGQHTLCQSQLINFCPYSAQVQSHISLVFPSFISIQHFTNNKLLLHIVIEDSFLKALPH